MTLDRSLKLILELLFVCLDSLCPSQQFISHFRMDFVCLFVA